MNLLITDPSPEIAAKNLDDLFLNQMLTDASNALSAPLKSSTPFYLSNFSQTAKNSPEALHPCSKWTRECQGNYSWTLLYFLWLCSEYEYRFGHKHEKEQMRNFLCAGYDQIDRGKQTPFINCAHKFIHVSPTYLAYQFFINTSCKTDSSIHQFTRRKAPIWQVV